MKRKMTLGGILICISTVFFDSRASDRVTAFDLSSVCGYSVESSRPLDIQATGCRLFYEDKVNSPAFYGSINSFKSSEKFYVDLTHLKYVNGRLHSLRNDYYDGARDTRQTIIKRRHYSFPHKNKQNTVIITRLEVDYLRETPGSSEIESVKEQYDCWDGVAYGTTFGVRYSLCSLVDARSAELFSNTRWQYQVIQSLKIQ
ncbi:hypothetical protein LMG3441_04459 [Achromobacter kerstersii]|jgi:hypothetical protein|uniref:Uncharacterized protein n=1 Tax=Achromobacter kerstersii TaxID=1353890 RepID=A0A6S7AI65_9BURK|nr:hypothetical protein LMG3441_04459 [Achromobacter kerstersii]